MKNRREISAQFEEDLCRCGTVSQAKAEPCVGMLFKRDNFCREYFLMLEIFHGEVKFHFFRMI